MLTNLYRSGKCSFRGPTASQSCAQSPVRHAKFFRPFSHAKCFAIVCQHAIASSVASLLPRRGPAAVFLRVAKQIIFAFYAVCGRRAQSHVSEEVGKLQPAVTHRDSTLTVAAIAGVVCVAATLLHGRPHVVFRQATPAMYRICTAWAAWAREASAFLASVFKIASLNRLYRSAFAAAKPSFLAAFGNRMKLQNSPATKYLAGQVYKVVGAAGRILSSHLSLLVRFDWIGPARSYDLLVGPFHCSMTLGA